MWQILLGALGFAVALAFDWASWQRKPYKPLLGLAAVGLFSTALVWTLATTPRFPWPTWVSPIGWPVMVAGGLLLVYSLFLEIPFSATYVRPGTGDRLVRTGTYALVRHPGILWFGLWVLGLVLVTRGRLILWGGLVWLLSDIAYVWLQERLLFIHMFPEYPAYQRETPMLIPTTDSLRRCWHTLGRCQAR